MIARIRQLFGQNKGFTLIELVVVIAILGILAAIAVPKFSQSAEAARGSKVLADLRTLDGAVAMAVANGATVASGASSAVPNIGTYIAAIPTPPTGQFSVTYNGASRTYVIAANTAYQVVAGTSLNTIAVTAGAASGAATPGAGGTYNAGTLAVAPAPAP